MISVFYELEFELKDEKVFCNWIENSMKEEGFSSNELNYIFCSDAYLLEMNKKHLQHNYFTDVIGFQYSKGKNLSGDIFISIDRVLDNANLNEVSFENELARVMIHGVLHFMNYDDYSEEDKAQMREAEDKYLAKFNQTC